MHTLLTEQLEKKQRVEGITIQYPQFTRAMRKIKAAHDSVKVSLYPSSALITGEVGSGKTRIFEEYYKSNIRKWDEPTEWGIQKKMNIVALTLRSPINVNGLLAQLLTAIGDPIPTAGKMQDKQDRLIKLIGDCGVELILVDEFHNIIDADKKKTLIAVANVFKTIINETRAALVFFGLDVPADPRLDSKIILKNSAELHRRVPLNAHLDRFSIKSKAERENFKRLLSSIDEFLPFDEHSRLDSSEYVERFHKASGGLIYSVKRLIDSAADIAITNNKSHIELNDFAKAFELNDFISRDRNGNLRTNPFIDKATSI